MEEYGPSPEEEAGQFVDEVLQEKYNQAVLEITNGCITDPQEFINKAREANSYLNIICGEDRNLFEEYRYHIFMQEGKYMLLQGHEIPCGPGEDCEDLASDVDH